MIKVFESDVLTVTKEDNSFLVLAIHPSTREPWKSEQEALAYSISNKFLFQSPEPEPVAPLLPLLTPVEFKLMFTPTERIAIKNTRPTDEILDDFMDIIDDPRLDTVNFNLQSTKDAIDYLVSIEVLTVERAVQVKTGVFL